jgi:hypothetical protein
MKWITTTLITAAALGGAAAITPCGARAQIAVSAGVGGGFTAVTGDASRVWDAGGFHMQGMVAFGRAASAVGFRTDLMYQRFTSSVAGEAGRTSDLAGIVSVVYSPTTYLLKPYVLGGVGVYRSTDNFDAPQIHEDPITRFGANAGLGARLSFVRFGTFVEARFHRIFGTNRDVDFVPVTVGVMF